MAAVGEPGPAAPGRRRAGLGPWLGIAPATLFVGLVLLGPSTYLVRLSLGFAEGEGWTLANYARVFTSDLYLWALARTLVLGLAVTGLTLLLGYPVAYFIARSGSRFVPVVLAATVLPLFVSVVVRSFGWMILLGREGTLNRLLLATGLADAPAQLLYTQGAVVLGLVHILAPLMILPVAAVLRGIDPAAEEAALSLGASRAAVFGTVILPLSLPGVAAGSVLVLSHVIAAFVLPALIGSDRVALMATMIYQQVMVTGDVALGAALAVVMLGATSLLVLLSRASGRRGAPA